MRKCAERSPAWWLSCMAEAAAYFGYVFSRLKRRLMRVKISCCEIAFKARLWRSNDEYLTKYVSWIKFNRLSRFKCFTPISIAGTSYTYMNDYLTTHSTLHITWVSYTCHATACEWHPVYTVSDGETYYNIRSTPNAHLRLRNAVICR